MEEFRFKRFAVRNERSAMKVNTDGVLLGAVMTVLPEDGNLLDVGTGTGTIALMAAQRLSDVRNNLGCGVESCREVRNTGFRIVALDIDKDSADEAASNFLMSPWPSCLYAVNGSLQEYCPDAAPDGAGQSRPFDHIFSNPPYFESSLKAPDERRRAARHADTLSYRDILEFARQFLSCDGRLSLILPAEQETETIRHAAASGLYPFRVVRVRTVPRKVPSRVILEFSRKRGDVAEELVIIQDKGTYTGQYRSLVKDFLLI